MSPAYSSTPLLQKLGLRFQDEALLENIPANYFELLDIDPVQVKLVKSNEPADFIHFFTTSQAELNKKLPLFAKNLDKAGMIWISWPKQASKVPTDLNENIIREVALNNGLVDVKVCSIDETWSGLKLVYRLANRRS